MNRRLIALSSLILISIITVTALSQNGKAQDDAANRREMQRSSLPGKAQPNDDSKAAQQTSSQTSSAVVTPDVASNYAFSTATNASFTDMTSGTTQLIAADSDDVASSVTTIGFEFFFQGTRFTQFSVNSNGSLRLGSTVILISLFDPLGQAGQSLITSYGADQRTHASNGKVHFKVTGSLPNRVLTVEWLNMEADFNAGGTADLTYQLKLYETTGVIESVYGPMAMSAAGAADPNSQSPQFGFSSNNAVGTVGSVTAAQTGTPAPTFNSGSATPVNNLYVAGTITVLDSAVDGARRIFSYTPHTPTAPTNLTFSSIATVSYTLNWTDSPDELGYAVYRSTDGVNFTFDGTAPQNATSYSATILQPNTTYFWRVFANSEGALSTVLTGNQTTATPNEVTSVGVGGLWSAPGTWSSGAVPTTNDNVTIINGSTVTIDTAATACNVRINVGGILQFEQTTARTLTLPLSLTIDSGGTFRSNPAGTQTGHNVSISGDLTNNGTLDLSTNADTAGAIITFAGASNNTFSGTGATTDIRQITVNKGTSSANIIELMPSNFTVRGVTTDTVVGGWLVLTNGTMKISGTFTGTSRVFGAAGYVISVTTEFWLNNPNYTVAGQNGSPTSTGTLRVSQGTFNVGIASGNSFGFSAGSTIIVEGGAINATGRFGVSAAGNIINYTQTGGTITVCTIGNASATQGSFDLGNSSASTISMTGGTIIVQLAATAIDYRQQSGAGANFGLSTVTGGTLQLGNAASGLAKTFNIRGGAPNVVVTNTSAGHAVNFGVALPNFTNFTLNLTINSGATFNIGNSLLRFNGTAVVNNGTLTATGVSSNFDWIQSAAPNTYSGSGTVTAPMTLMSFETSQTVTFDPASPNVVVGRLNMLSGGAINSNKLTLGNGGATAAMIQFGQTVPTSPVLGFDVPPVFNPGTLGVYLIYEPELTGRTTGNEMPPSRTLSFLSANNPNALTIAGGDITINSSLSPALSLIGGRIITGANTLYVPAGTITRTTGWVDGNLKRVFTGIGAKTFDVGTANGYSPVTVNVTAGAFSADFAVRAVQGPQPNQNPATSLQRYWVLESTGITANLTFNYLDGDVLSTEANYDLVKVSGGVSNRFPNGTSGVLINTGTNTASITGVTSFSDWTLAEPPPPTISSISPTSAQLSSSGQTITINGDGFLSTSTLEYDGASHPVLFINNLQLSFVLAPADTLSTGAKTVKIINPGPVNSNTVLFTIDPANVCSSQTTDVAPGASGRATVLPGGCAANGVDAVLGHDAGAPSDAMLYVANYSGANPTTSPLLDVGGGFVDLKVTNAVATDSVTATFYYPSAITGADETGLNLLYFTGNGWKLVTGSGGASPVKDTTDDQNGTTSGGTFTVTFDSTSIPKITELTGTVFTFSTISPTAVNFDSAEVTQVGNSAVVEWKTGMEVNNLGFNVYRQSGGQRVKVNPSLIAGSALMVGSDVRLQSGYTYSWQDDVTDRTATYWIEDVDLNGSSTWHGPFGISSSNGSPRQMTTRTRSTLLNNLSSSAGKQTNAEFVREYVAGFDTGAGSAVKGSTAGVSQSTTAGRTPTKATSSVSSSLQKQWQIAAQQAVKIAINKTGWYHVNLTDIAAAGLSANPNTLQMFVRGVEVPIKVSADSIEFYGSAINTASSDTEVYWLTSGTGTGKRINVQQSLGSNNNGPASFQYTIERKDRTLYFSSLRNGDAENWFGPVINTNPVSQTINVHNHDANSVGQAQIEVALQGVTTNAHQVTVSLNGQALNTTTFDGMNHQVLRLSVPESSLIEGNNQITLSAATSGDVSLVDYVRVTYAHTYTADGNSLSASVTGIQPVKISGFTSDQIRVIDVANTNQPIELVGTIDGDAGSYSISVNGAKRRNLMVFTPDKVLQPLSITGNQPTTISNASNGADFVIITNKDFAASIQPLVSLRQSQGYQVKVVDVDNIYDEFSYGEHSPAAVKDFLNWTYTRWQKQPQFVMLAGSGTLDPRNYTGLGFMDFVPTKLIDTSSMETASDDWFVDFNNDGRPQMSIGRLPVHTAAEASLVINKIIAYEQSGPVQGVTLVSDLNDGIDFNSANNQIRAMIPANLPVVGITRTQTVADARAALMDQLNQGGQIINYAGHGTVNLWRAGLLTNSDMASLANHGTSPLIVTMTCLNGYFQDPKLASLGESLLKVNNGGAVSVWASSAMTDSGNQTLLNQEFFRQLFGHPTITIGEAIKAAKGSITDDDVRKTWILFGDPAMRIRQ